MFTKAENEGMKDENLIFRFFVVVDVTEVDVNLRVISVRAEIIFVLNILNYWLVFYVFFAIKNVCLK